VAIATPIIHNEGLITLKIDLMKRREKDMHKNVKDNSIFTE